MSSYVCMAPDVKLGKEVNLAKFINLGGCEIGDETKIDAGVFEGHGVAFINDTYPRATLPDACKAKAFPSKTDGTTLGRSTWKSL